MASIRFRNPVVGVEPRHLVLVLIGEELEVVAGHRLGQRGAAWAVLGLGLADPVDQRG